MISKIRYIPQFMEDKNSGKNSLIMRYIKFSQYIFDESLHKSYPKYYLIEYAIRFSHQTISPSYIHHLEGRTGER